MWLLGTLLLLAVSSSVGIAADESFCSKHQKLTDCNCTLSDACIMGDAGREAHQVCMNEMDMFRKPDIIFQKENNSDGYMRYDPLVEPDPCRHGWMPNIEDKNYQNVVMSTAYFSQRYHYKVLVGRKVTSWKQAKDECEKVNARLPVFMHKDYYDHVYDVYPGVDLLHFHHVVKAIEIASLHPLGLISPFMYKYQMGGHWKRCFPIGLVYNPENQFDIDSDQAWSWFTNHHTKNPHNYDNDDLKDYKKIVKGKYWKGNPSNQFAGHMKFGYLMSGSDEAYYFNDFNDLNRSQRQYSSYVQKSADNVLEEVCPADNALCVPCTPQFILCQRRQREGYYLKADPIEMEKPDESIIPPDDPDVDYAINWIPLGHEPILEMTTVYIIIGIGYVFVIGMALIYFATGEREQPMEPKVLVAIGTQTKENELVMQQTGGNGDAQMNPGPSHTLDEDTDTDKNDDDSIDQESSKDDNGGTADKSDIDD